MNGYSISQAGRWVRRGREIILLPGGGSFNEVEGETGPVPATTQGVIHPAIDVHAQYALMRMSRGDPAAQADAWGMLGAVRADRLGIYKVDQLKPAQRAQKLGSSWWTVIPAGEDAAVLADPVRLEPPFIVFRDAVKNNAARLDPALRKAWRTVGMLDRCTVPGAGGPIADISPGSVVPANLVPRLICVASRPSAASGPPRRMPVLTHYHRRSIELPPGSPCNPGEVTVMVPEAMNPGFINSASGLAIRTSGPGSLQQKLNASITRLFPNRERQVAAAVVDLTGDLLCRPMFAGWQEMVNLDAGSLAKICALYAVFQLRFDLQSMARRQSITRADKLLSAAEAEWADADLPKREQPQVSYLFDLASSSNGPVSVTPTRRLAELLECTFTHNCNWTASILINRVGLPYISSALWSAGLLDTRTRSGLWLRSGFCSGPDANDCDIKTSHCPEIPKDGLDCRRREALRATGSFGAELGLANHNATALSVASFYTLLAQDRLPAPSGTSGMSPWLRGACANFKAYGLLTCVFRRLGKCGFTRGSGIGTGELHHDGLLVERWTDEGCGARPIRYVVVLLTNGVPGARNLFGDLLQDVDRMILENNGISLKPASAEARRPPGRVRLPGR